jgi:hypothetical protein
MMRALVILGLVVVQVWLAPDSIPEEAAEVIGVADVVDDETPAPENWASLPAPKIIGSYSTKYDAGSARGHNIERAAKVFADGRVIEPSETLSFNERVGPRDQRHGFYKAPIIEEGVMRDGDGGGVCQVSSTIYAAARMAGLTIVERSNHSRPSAYIAAGLDAMVSYPSKDLRIRNDFEEAVALYVDMERDSKKRWLGTVTAKFYGVRTYLQAEPPRYTVKSSVSGPAFSVRYKEEAHGAEAVHGVGWRKKIQKGTFGSIALSRVTFADGRWTEWRSVYSATDEVWLVKPGTDYLTASQEAQSE